MLANRRASRTPPEGYSLSSAGVARTGHHLGLQLFDRAQDNALELPAIGMTDAVERHPARSYLVDHLSFGTYCSNPHLGDRSDWAGGPTTERLDDLQDENEHGAAAARPGIIDAVAARLLERAWMDLVDDATPPPAMAAHASLRLSTSSSPPSLNQR